MSRWFVTVSIPYVNAPPHVGYALELMQADVLSRSRRQLGDEVRFLGGTDDHALKNVLAAEAAGVPVAELVRSNARRFSDLGRALGISFDDFIHTASDPRHAPGVARLWRESAARGDFYKGRYEGWYCVGCEQFYPETGLEGDGTNSLSCPEHVTPLERVAEDNWFFRLASYRDRILEAVQSGELLIAPEVYRNEVLSLLRNGLVDLSVSRSAARARGWGIPVPGDPDQVVYVWWDALANYVTSLGYGTGGRGVEQWWCAADERVHVIGKGILKFHAVYWPAMLLSVGLPLPTRIYVHPYLTVEGEKISKSTGNGPDPGEIASRFGTDALRWWLCREVTPAADADFSIERLVARADEDLANGLGNLAARVGTMIARYLPGGVTPRLDAPNVGSSGTELAQALVGLQTGVHRHIERYDLRSATGLVSGVVSQVNRYIDTTRPWELARRQPRIAVPGEANPAAPPAPSAPGRAELKDVLGLLAGALAELARAVEPILPEGAARLGHRSGPAFPRIGARR